MKVVISPFSRALRDDKMSDPLKARNPERRNPKDFPYESWGEVVQYLVNNGHHVIQIGVRGEASIVGCHEYKFGLSLDLLEALARDCDIWISVDNFWHHLCHCIGRNNGIVIFSKSDPIIFGYPEQMNLLKDRKWLRPMQAEWWEMEPYEFDSFVSAGDVIGAFESLKH